MGWGWGGGEVLKPVKLKAIWQCQLQILQEPSLDIKSAHYSTKGKLADIKLPFSSSLLLCIFSHKKKARIKKFIEQKYIRTQRTEGVNPFQIPSVILRSPGSHFGLCSLCRVAGIERVPRRHQAGIHIYANIFVM